MAFYTGSAVWAYSGWVGSFFPKGTKQADYLREYARRLTTAEGNTTFYARPSPETVSRWREDTPRGFRFCPKLPRSVSHAGLLMPHRAEARAFIDLMRGLGTRLGPLFLQLPPRYSPKLINDLRSFLAAWPRDTQCAVEVRHLDWFTAPHHEALNALLREHDMARVLIDTRPIRDLPESVIEQGQVKVRMDQARERKPDVPLLPERTASFAFVRYIGHPQIDLNAPLLDEWADRFADWLAQPCEGSETFARVNEVYAFCHCPDETVSPQICRELHRRVAARVDIDPLPWDSAADETKLEQGRLF
jgi:uncharacterized protein YecE (DUF72 family)